MATAPLTATTPDLSTAMAAIGFRPYPEQLVVERRLSDTAARRAVGFVEAPTATGKTHCIAHHAMVLSIDEGHPVVVAVPSLALAQTTLDAMLALGTARGLEGVICRIVVGRQEFLSPFGLDDLVRNAPAPVAKAVSRWVSDGAPGRADGHPAWTRDGLQFRLDSAGIAGPDISQGGALALGRSDMGTPAWKAYEAQFRTDADVYVVSHAMLGRDLLSRFVEMSRARRKAGLTVDVTLPPIERWLATNMQRLEMETGTEGRLPDHGRLIVDEAHLLRDAIESAMSSSISLHALRRHCAALGRSALELVQKRHVEAVDRVLERCVSIGRSRQGRTLPVSWADEDPIHDVLRELHDALSGFSTRKASADLEADAEFVERARMSLAEALRARDAVRTTIEWSPVRGFPVIEIGRRSLNAELDLLWRRLDSAALVSATLYTDNVSGPSIGHTRGRLRVPEERSAAFPPILAPWLLSPVDAHVPSPTTAASLEPGTTPARLDAIADHIARIVDHIASGTLVLTTSIADTSGLVERLKTRIDPMRIIDGSKGRMAANRDLLVSAARSSGRPVWIAQGPAWTGLDLPDDCLDTLVVTRLPFPRPDSPRRGDDAPYGQHKIAQMAMTCKQGFGRLVRSRSAGPKTLHVLDGRIMSPNAGGVLSMLKAYRHHRF